MTTPTFEVVTMTPQWASQLLGQSAQKNRKFKRKHLERLTHTIQSGNWYITAQGIALDSEDNILDGQHRLAAVVKAEKPIQIMLVVILTLKYLMLLIQVQQELLEMCLIF